LFIGRPSNSKESIYVSEMILNTFESVSFIIELWKSMSGAVNDTEDLRERDQEVEDLRQEEEEHGLCEVTQDTHHREGHTRKVAKGVSYEDLRGEFVVLEQTQSHKDKRNNDCHREDVVRHYFRGGSKIDFL
jgi:hypothetical protein